MEALSHVPAPPNHPPTPAATQALADALQQAGSIAQAATPEDTSARDKGVDGVQLWIARARTESAHEQMAADEAAASRRGTSAVLRLECALRKNLQVKASAWACVAAGVGG